ncbi:hypothetical protein AMTRI_Chr04g187720 [Amborella trichopoda]
MCFHVSLLILFPHYVKSLTPQGARLFPETIMIHKVY